jgi:Ca-activated chloride channel family protein
MQRIAVVYGLAAATLVGAFFLVPRTDAPPTVAPPTKVDGKTPITELIYADGTLEVTARLDRGYVAPTGEPVWMDVTVKASGVATRAPLTTVLVIDRSGSMAGDKIDAARAAAERYVLALRDGDVLGIVTYGTDTTVDLPLTLVDTASRQRALAVVRALEEGGGTNIDGGLRAATAELARADQVSSGVPGLRGRVGRVVLISDGRPTEGDRREATLAGHASTLRERGVVTSTLGVGLDYNEDLMEQIARSGGGRYHYLRDGAQLARILDDELKQATAVVATRVQLVLPASLGGKPAPLAFEDAPGQQVQRGSGVTIDVGDLAAGEERHVLVKLQVTGFDGAAAFAAPEVVYRPAGDADGLRVVAHRTDPFRLFATADITQVEQSRRDDVRGRVLQLEASLALNASMKAYASGDGERARRTLATKLGELRGFAEKNKDAAVAAEAQNLSHVMDAVAAAPAPSSEGAQDLIKAQKARAFTLQR